MDIQYICGLHFVLKIYKKFIKKIKIFILIYISFKYINQKNKSPTQS